MMMARDEFAVAAERAAGKTCPINELPASHTNHWDACDPCGAFSCTECVAEPEDIGLGGLAPDRESAEGVDWEIPF